MTLARLVLVASVALRSVAAAQCADQCGLVVTTAMPFCSCEATCGAAIPCCADVESECRAPVIVQVQPRCSSREVGA